MTRTLGDALGWIEHGTKLVREILAALDEDTFGGSSLLPGWTRRHVAAHLAANADAVGNLVRWAATGKPTAMYSSPEQRTADIASGGTRTGSELLAQFETSATRLSAAMGALTPAQWAAEVVTAQGRTVPASELPWLRAREVMVHAVDLRQGVTFADLSSDFLHALAEDVVAKRSAGEGTRTLVLQTLDAPFHWQVDGTGEPAIVVAPLFELVAYLTGRPAHVDTPTGLPAPVLSAWL